VKFRNDPRNVFVDLKANDQHRNIPLKRSIDNVFVDYFDGEIVSFFLIVLSIWFDSIVYVLYVL